ncbi:MAG: hypothetical protein B6D77_07420 [gamma proteobacterium symbiont of Ctena orbiculata]|uniref:hypothetical protein n=1 Tax=Candidatus Thiodiazotropha sp. CDECU1 TaxID=3065865 RepID=UPI000D587680|nr:hypothetical protein [Candidatus Thiodiazotropha sp. CDECU1]PVV11075.1 MAG: hypothetical protein B6D77_07420 [gamma proteobacterium symbiont of Ctena orbiculata]PVV18682.1 MAG: hypothetical protein B6D78_15595 [gamma proteobacterium symbiont of Ctena orbiculata]PVV27097.1 MAG: hypothetical protein B6D79_04165 [gamma proteobacterium symbiont of Ctena orbiculata]
MKMVFLLLVLLIFLTSPCYAVSKEEVRIIIDNSYPGARITEIEKERYKGKKIYEVDFVYKGDKLEAIISLDGSIIKVGNDD